MQWLRHVALTALIIAGCATTSIPESIRTPPPEDISVSQVRQAPDRYEGRRVRWGGTIVQVKNQETETWLEIVSRDLSDEGRPLDINRSAGRFFAVIQGFLDPAIYASGREVTVVGQVTRVVQQKIDQYPYRYPVLRADIYYMWRPEPAYPSRYYYYDPFWYYDPWWPHPYYPWRYRPYYW